MTEATPVSREAGAIEPFWRCIPRFFAFPFHLTPLLYCVFLSFAVLAGTILPVPDMLGIALAMAIVWLAFLRYAYAVLEQTSLGFDSPDQFEQFSDPDKKYRPYKQFAVLFVYSLGIGLATELLGKAAGTMAYILVALAIPASVMCIAISNSARQALNPFALMQLMTTVGWPYLALWMFVNMLSGASLAVFMFLGARLPAWLQLPVFNLASMYFTLVMFRMMGYVLYQYHQPLGLDVKAEFGRPGSSAKPVDVAGDRIGRLVADGDLPAALDLAYEEQRTLPESMPAHDRYHKLLRLADRKERCLSHGQSYIGTLLRLGQGARAVEIYRDCSSLDGEFRPAEGKHVLPLADAARAGRQYDLALRIMRGFDKRWPHHSDIPSVYLLSARILCEHLHQDDLARRILAAMQVKYPGHPRSEEAAKYLSLLDRLPQAAPNATRS